MTRTSENILYVILSIVFPAFLIVAIYLIISFIAGHFISLGDKHWVVIRMIYAMIVLYCLFTNKYR